MKRIEINVVTKKTETISLTPQEETDALARTVVWKALEMELSAQVAVKAQAFTDNLSSWAAVESTIDNIANLAEAKAFLKKLARVVYWLAKNTEE